MNVTTCSTFVFCPPPQGKPNPKESRPVYGPDTRTRILQKGLKDNTCWYAAFNLLRDRYKAPNTQSLAARHFEMIASQRRKELSAHERSLHPITYHLNYPSCQEFLTSVTKNSVRKSDIQEVLEQINQNYTQSFSPILLKFLGIVQK